MFWSSCYYWDFISVSVRDIYMLELDLELDVNKGQTNYC